MVSIKYHLTDTSLLPIVVLVSELVISLSMSGSSAKLVFIVPGWSLPYIRGVSPVLLCMRGKWPFSIELRAFEPRCQVLCASWLIRRTCDGLWNSEIIRFVANCTCWDSLSVMTGGPLLAGMASPGPWRHFRSSFFAIAMASLATCFLAIARFTLRREAISRLEAAWNDAYKTLFNLVCAATHECVYMYM